MPQNHYKHPDLGPLDFQGIVTTSPQMKRFFELMQRVARTDTSVLIRGDTGTGKELVAQAIHRLSGRAKQSWQALNCATLTPDLLASELFGHVKGAFTGAIADRRGLFELADHGTLFLDEIAEISFEIQARLLRVLQEKNFVRVGDTRATQVDVRLISATNKALRTEVERGHFREDLMYRIRVVKLLLPRLVDRSGDVVALVWHFIDEFNQQGFRRVETIHKNAMEAIMSYDWPGNIRELRNAIEGAFAIGEGPMLILDDLPPELRGEFDLPQAELVTERDLERDRILKALSQTHGQKSDTAKLLNMSRSTLWRKMREYRIG